MADDLAEVTSIQLTDAPASIQLDVYRGSEADRGAYIIPGSGNPSLYFDVATQTYTFPDPTGAEEELVAQLYDWYLDLDTTSPTYMSTFQLKKTNQWEQIFKVIPNVYNTNRILNFSNGVATTNVVVPKETLLLSQKFGDQSKTTDFNIFRIPSTSDTTSTVTSEAAMLALTGQSIGNYAYRSDRSQFFRLISLPSSDIGSWQEELAINLDVDIENAYPGLPYPVMSAFTAGKPTYNGTNYTFPITINASQVMPGTNLVTNPSMETVTSGSVVMRRNLMTDPSMQSGTYSIYFFSASSTYSYSTTKARTGTKSLSLSRTTTTPGSINGYISQGIPVTAGQTYTISGHINPDADTTFRIGIRFGQSATYPPTSPNVSVTASTSAVANTWTRNSVTNTAPNGATHAFVYIDAQTAVFTDTVRAYFDDFLLEASTVAGDYFDGSTTDALGWDYAWSGTANASISTAACAATTVRTNLVNNPNFEGGATTGWATDASTIAASTAQAKFGTYSLLVSPTANNGGTYYNNAVTSGTTYTWSVWVFTTVTKNLRVVASGYPAGTTTLVPANTWTRLSVTYTATASATIPHYVSGTDSTQAFYVDGALFEISSTLGDYFDGSFNPAGDFSYAWTGTANASTSIQRGATVASYAPSSVGSVASREWTLTGNQSLRVIPTSTSNNDTFVSLGGDAGAFRLGMSVGNTYTVSGTIRLAAAQTGTLNARARRIAFFYKNSAGTYVEAQSAQAPNSAGATRLSVTVSIPTGATEAFIRLYNGALVGGGDVWWDNVLVVEGNYTGEYFDINPYPINSPRTAHISISVI